jgi:phosphoserine aminotransferase
MKPNLKPDRAEFSSGPCVKRPGWEPSFLAAAALGRSHRASPARERLEEVIERCRALLGLPDGHLIGIVPASDTGAMEMALWSLLGARGVDLLAWESFGHGWVTDVVKQLKLRDVRVLAADYGDISDLAAVDFARDVVLCWNGTTSGVRVSDGDWIAAEREGLVIADATSAAFAMPIPWDKVDVATFSWQKALGGEAQHGMLVLGPRAIARLESYQPPWPLPKLFRMLKDGKLNRDIFKGATINTPSLLATEDMLDALRWAERIGGGPALIRRTEANFATLNRWVQASDWIDFLAREPRYRSPTSVCLKLVAPWFTALAETEQRATVKALADRLAAEGVAYDIAGHRDSPPSLRIWCGATVEAEDLARLGPWLDWAYGEVKAARRSAA